MKQWFSLDGVVSLHMKLMRIPAELRALARWVVWRWEPDPARPGKRKKPPYVAGDLSRHASSTDSSTWRPFEVALAAVGAGHADGVGFALGPPYAGVDLDEELSELEQHEIIDLLDSYTERSPSQTGHHVVCRATLDDRGRHPRGIGVFTRARLFYFTGEHVPDTLLRIEDRQQALEAVLARYVQPRAPLPPPLPPRPVSLDDRELLERALCSRGGASFERLWLGDVNGYPSHSEADLALACKLAFWFGREPERMDAVFRSSGLYRDKWYARRGDTTYGERTLRRACALTRDTYTPPQDRQGRAAGRKARPAEKTRGSL